jgi:heat shock protein HslJ
MERISAVIINELDNRYMKNILIFSFIVILVGFGCNKTSVKDAALLKTKWTLSYLQDTKTNSITHYPSDAAREISIVFTDSLNIISFWGICNGGAGTYTYSPIPGAIKISSIASTQIACKYVEWEGYTTQNLTNAFSYKINGNNLVIYSNGAYNLYFTKN